MGSDTYERHRNRAAELSASRSRDGRDIGPPPDVVDQDRRDGCKRNLMLYLETYHWDAFPLEWCDDHRTAIARIEQAVLNGNQFAVAMPRGSGKTTILERAILWAMLYRHHAYAFLIAANDGKAKEAIQHVQMELVCNELLFEDFPDICHPLRAIEWIAQRARGQLMDGEPTFVKWEDKLVIFPTVNDQAGAVLKGGGIESAVRGAQHVTRDGRVIRPSVVLIDDPQTRKTAASPKQCNTRTNIVSSDVLGMAGPGESIAAMMACTVIFRDDMADRILNRELHPHWRGQRTKMLVKFPTRIDLWTQYNEILTHELQNDGDGSQATAFYVDNQDAMDAGAVVSWDDRFEKNEVSAIQNAMNLWLKDQESFFSEYQNDPIDDAANDDEMLTVAELVKRTNGYAHNLVPADASHLTMFTDVHDKLLYFVVIAWADDFTGYVIDYGTFPEQKTTFFTMRSSKTTLATKFRGLTLEARIRKGLDWLLHGSPKFTGYLEREWIRDGDGAALQIELAGIDARYKTDDVVMPFIRESPYRSRILPTFGQGVTARMKPFSEYEKKTGDRTGRYWRVPKLAGKRALRHLSFDTNFWKSFTHARFATDPAERGSLTLFKAAAKRHRMFAEQQFAEKKKRITEEERRRTVDEWKAIPGRDNHLFDCVVGNAACGSVTGAELRTAVPDDGDAPKPKSKRRVRRSRSL